MFDVRAGCRFDREVRYVEVVAGQQETAVEPVVIE